MSKEAHERFVRIHQHYVFFNHLFSMGMDIGWRNEAAGEAIIDKDRYSVLDIATGTGDLAFTVKQMAEREGKDVKILGTDFNVQMLNHAKAKSKQQGLANISFKEGDALKTGLPSSSFDVVTSGFALRSFDNLQVFAHELKRIMKSGGKFVLLDMARPDHNQQLTKAYFKIIPVVGSLVDRQVYAWLTTSIWKFDKRAMADILRKEGFRNVKLRNLRSGIAYIITGTKP